MGYQKEYELNTFRKLVHETFGKEVSGFKQLKAHASERKIYRIFADELSLIGIHNENANENSAFINFSKSFRELGLNVPLIYNESEDQLDYIEEDLGDITLHNLKCSDEEKLSYCRLALSDLIQFQIRGKDKIDFSCCYQTSEFNYDVINSDIGKFSEYFGKFTNNKNFKDEMTLEVIEICGDVLSQVDREYFLYRDFQPRNIMVKEGRLYYIDYQSGRRGPLHYDVASFLFSGSIILNDAERNSLLNFYIDKLGEHIKVNEKDFRHFFYFFAYMRMLQVIGSYSYLAIERNDSHAAAKINKAIDKLDNITKVLKINIFEKYLEKMKN